jgi:hypothetical protein
MVVVISGFAVQQRFNSERQAILTKEALFQKAEAENHASLAEAKTKEAVAAQREAERRQVNLLAELTTGERLRGNLDTALRLGVHAARLALALDEDGAGISAPGTALAAVLSQSDWRLVLRGHENFVRSAAFSPDGTRITTASLDKTARIWDAATAKEIAVLCGHEDSVWSAAFSPDGTRIVTASNDKTARIWDAAAAKQIAVLRGHEDPVRSAAFSRDGTRIVTASLDKTARIWDAATAKEIAVLHGHENWVHSAAFSPDGTRIVTASEDHTARIWDTHLAVMSTKYLVAEVCTRLLPGLTELNREDMRLSGYADSTAEINVCAGIK